jgi:DNA polymerase-3 subunit alpha
MVLTKQKQEEMCFGTLDDGTGTQEFVVFPKTYALYKQILNKDSIVILKGKLSVREGKLNLQVEKAREPQIVVPDETTANMLTIPRGTSKEKLQEIGKYLKSRPGEAALSVIIPNGEHQTVMKLPYKIEWNEQTKDAVSKILES